MVFAQMFRFFLPFIFCTSLAYSNKGFFYILQLDKHIFIISQMNPCGG